MSLRIELSSIIFTKNNAHNCSETNVINQPKIFHNDLSKLVTAKPLPSKKFRMQRILRILSKHFANCWQYEKSTSTKLSFYNSCKQKFGREAYLDTSKGFWRRYNTTKIRISSHDLEIESGRYNMTPRELRICNWCKCSMRTDVIEDENHLLFECDLYAGLRSKLITRLNNAPKIESIIPLDTECTLKIDNRQLRPNLMKLLSQHTSPNFNDTSTDAYNYHHKMLSNKNVKIITPEIESLLHHCSYIINCVCTFICHAYETRQKYIKEMREISTRKNTIIFNFT